MRRNLLLIVCFAFAGMSILIPLKASTCSNAGRLEEENTEFCDHTCDGGGEGTNHAQGTGNDNAQCDECAPVIWDVCEEFVNHDSVCVSVGPHTKDGCPNYNEDPDDTVYNEDAREYTD